MGGRARAGCRSTSLPSRAPTPGPRNVRAVKIMAARPGDHTVSAFAGDLSDTADSARPRRCKACGIHMAHANKLVGKCINASLGRWESLWAPEKLSAVALEDEDAIFDKLLYVLGNPVEASLVPSWRQWPGAISGPRACAAEPRVVRQPAVFFREDGGMPKSLRLRATVPPCFSKLGPKRFAAKLAASLTAHEAQLRKDNAAKGLTVLGRKAVLEQDSFDRPKSFDPRRGLNPRVACKDKWRRIEALARRKEFLEAHREAWESFQTRFAQRAASINRSICSRVTARSLKLRIERRSRMSFNSVS